MIALEVLKRLERKTGKMIHELFDFMVGVSTGSIITSLLGIKKLTVEEVDEIYNRYYCTMYILAGKTFCQPLLVGC